MTALNTATLVVGLFFVATPCDAQTREAVREPAVTTQSAATKSISRTRLQQVLGGSPSSIRVVRAAGVTDLSPSAMAAIIAPGEFVFRKMSDTARRVSSPRTGSPAVDPMMHPNPIPPPLPGSAPGSEVFAMPYRWMTVDSAGVERLLMPYFVMLGGGLTYDPATRLYRGIALVGVEDTLHQDAHAVTLARPLRMQLAATNGGKVMPAQLAISHTSFDYDSVRIESPDSTQVRIRTGADPAGIVIPISVLRLVAALTPQQTTLPGFGLSTTDIAISLPRGMARSDTVSVTLSSTGAPVRPATIDVTGRQGATVRLRSGRLGDNTIRAFIDGVQVGETVVASEFPLGFVIATIVGILIGGLARFVGAKRRKRVRSLPWDIAKGSPVGLLAAIGGAVGLDMLQLKLDDPAAFPAIIVTAAFGAWFGTKLLDSTSASRAVAGA